MADIKKMRPRTGRMLKEDGTVINMADLLAGGMQLTGSYVGYSTDAKPTITSYTPGTEITFLELDTGDVYVYDGTDWVVLV